MVLSPLLALFGKASSADARHSLCSVVNLSDIEFMRSGESEKEMLLNARGRSESREVMDELSPNGDADLTCCSATPTQLAASRPLFNVSSGGLSVLTASSQHLLSCSRFMQHARG